MAIICWIEFLLLAVGLPLSFLVFLHLSTFLWYLVLVFLGDWRLGLLVWGFSVLPDPLGAWYMVAAALQ